MNTYRLIVRVPSSDGRSHEDRSLYVESPSAEAARTLCEARALNVREVASVQPSEVPPTASVQRVHAWAPRPSLLRDNPPARRLLFMLIGVGAGLLVIIGTLFVVRAREHLTRSDIQPRVPAGTTAAGEPSK